MARFKPWLKMWGNWMNNPSLVRLNLGQKGAWWELYTLAHNCGAGGRLITNSGRGLTLDEIIKSLHIDESSEVRIFKNMIDKMLEEGSLCWEDDTLVLTCYTEEQETTTTGTKSKGTKEAAAERQRRWRERQQLPSPLEPPSPKEEDNVSVSMFNKDKEEERNGRYSITQQPFPGSGITDSPLPNSSPRARQGLAKGSPSPEAVTDYPLQEDPILKEICFLYEQNIGPLPPDALMMEDLKDFVLSFRGDISWIKLAFKVALGQNKRKWNYIRGILENWQLQGGPDGRAAQGLEREQQRKAGRQPGPAAHREDAGEGGRFSGFRAIESGSGQPDDRDED